MTPKELIIDMFATRKRWRFLIILCTFGASTAGIISPYLQKLFIDSITHSPSASDPFHFSPLVYIFGSFLFLVMAQGLNLLSSYLGTQEALILQDRLAEKLYGKTLLLRTDSLRGRTVGEMVSLYATDIMGATIFIEQTLPTGATTLFPLIMAPLALHWLYDLPLTPLLLVLVVVIFINSILAFRQSTFFMRFKELAAERIGLANEWVQNMRTLKILGWIEAYENKIITKRKTETANRVTMVTNGQVMNSISSSITFFINLVAVYTLVQYKPSVTPGDLLSLLWVLGIFLTRPFRQMPWFFTFGFDGWTSTKRLSHFLQLRNSGNHFQHAVSSVNDESLNVVGGAVEIKNLCLNIRKKQILKNITFSIQPKEFVAIVGEVGAGKTMLLLSLMGETGADMDAYHIQGKNMLSSSLTELCKYFAYVPQDGFVMSASLRENIALEYQFSNKLDARILNSLEQSQFKVRNENLPEQLDTEIGERGVNLSGGQKQRVNLARADFYDCPIVLLDDSLSALDVNTEKAIIEKLLKGQWKNKTRILATHRLSVLKEVDRIFYLVEGRIEASGTLEELLNHSSQFRDYVTTLDTEQSSDLTKKNNEINKKEFTDKNFTDDEGPIS